MSRNTPHARAAALLLLVALLAACVRPQRNGATRLEDAVSGGDQPEALATAAATSEAPLAVQMGTAVPDYAGRPTPDAPHYDAVGSTAAVLTHTVAIGESLGLLAQQYGTTIDELMTLNGLENADVIHVGQELQVPGQNANVVVSPDFKIIPDSELVYGPAAEGFSIRDFATRLNSHLLRYEEEVEGQRMAGPEIVQLVADRHSVNPRLLLTVLEHQAGWLTNESVPPQENIIGYVGGGSPGLYGQLSWAANLLNLGYYGRAEGGLRSFDVAQSGRVFLAPTLNDGTAGVQLFLASVAGTTLDAWQREVGPEGFYATYSRLFGNPFAYTVEPVLPDDLQAPALVLPWSPGETWYLTSGPHGAWNSGSAWAALDFVPPAEQAGCVPSDKWVTAMAGGVVTRSGNGAVVVDLDGDGYAGTGWAITYQHIETRDRVPVGTELQAGDRIGHPSCEGGFSNGTHVHIARSYNGRWISADGSLPFNMDGWVSQGAGSEYDGYLVRGDVTKGACVCREDVNAITRE